MFQITNYDSNRTIIWIVILSAFFLVVFAIVYVINVDLQMFASIKNLKKYDKPIPKIYLIIQKMVGGLFLKINYMYPVLFQKKNTYWSVMLSNALDAMLVLQIGIITAVFAVKSFAIPDFVLIIYISVTLLWLLYRLIKGRMRVRKAEKEYEESLKRDHKDIENVDGPSGEDGNR